MNSTRAARVRDIFLLSTGLVLFAYFIARALGVSISADEAGSWQMFASKGEIFPAEYGYFSANNHALNTALMMLFEKLFGTSAFVLRLPNVLAGGLYLFSTAMMVRRFPSPLLAVLAFALLNTNPFMIQYFNVARGYGLAAGLMAFAFWQVWKYFDDGAALKNLLAASLAASLAVFANYTYLNLFLPLAAFTGLFILFHRGGKQLGARSRVVHAALLSAFVIAVLSVVIPVGSAIKAAGGFWPSSWESFWTQSVASVIDGMLFDVCNRDPRVIYKGVILAGEVYFAASLVVLGRAFITRKDGERNYFPLFVFVTLTLSAVSVVLQHLLLDLEYPVQRIGLFMVWPLLLLVSLAAGLSKKNYWFVLTPFGLLTGFLVWHFASTASSWRESFHPASEQVYETIEYLREITPEGENIRIAVDPVIMSCGFDFYMTTLRLNEFDVMRDTSFQNTLNRYCFVSRDYMSRVPLDLWKMKKGYGNGNALFESTRIQRQPVVERQLNTTADTVTVLSQWMPYFPAGGRWLDSLPDTTHLLAHIEMELWRADEDARARTWLYLYHEGKEVFVYSVDLTRYPARDGWQKIRYDIVLPRVAYSDDLIAGTYWEGGPATQIKNFTLTVKAY
jgi:hypothetical protein